MRRFGVQVPRGPHGVKNVKQSSVATKLGQKPLMQAKDDGDLHGGQRSTQVKRSKLRNMATKLVDFYQMCDKQCQ